MKASRPPAETAYLSRINALSYLKVQLFYSMPKHWYLINDFFTLDQSKENNVKENDLVSVLEHSATRNVIINELIEVNITIFCIFSPYWNELTSQHMISVRVFGTFLTGNFS